MKKIEINPMTRIEGHGKIAIFLDDSGNVDEVFFQVVEFHGFEKFLVGCPSKMCRLLFPPSAESAAAYTSPQP